MDGYQEFLASKTVRAQAAGIQSKPMPAHMFDYQIAATEFLLRQGRAALFLDTGLGKTICELEFARQASDFTDMPALLLTPLAVARQIEREGLRFGYQCRVIREIAEVGPGINICNYDRLERLDPGAFGCVVLDESSILKSFSGKTTMALIAMFADVPFRLCATATPAPNDHVELGTHAEFLGIMTQSEMLVRWFLNDSADTGTWRLKGHAVEPFWDWVTSWAVLASLPSDITNDVSSDAMFALPPLNMIRHQSVGFIKHQDGFLFSHDVSATHIHDVKRQTTEARTEIASTLIMKDMSCLLTVITSTRANAKGMPTTPHIEIAANPTTTDGSGRNMLPIQNSKKRSLRKDANGLRKTPIGNDDTTLGSDTISLNEITESCSLTKGDHAQFAGPREIGSTSTIATKTAASEDFFVMCATEDSGNSETIQKTCGEPPPTSTTTPKMAPWIVWCDTNYEQDALESALSGFAVSISGSQSAEVKENLLEAWRNDVAPVLICKPSMFGYGLNLQRCSRMIFLGRSFSYEAWYQAVRRCWRFGQTEPVDVHLMVAEGEDQIGRVIDRKADGHAAMKAAMRAATKRNMGAASAVKVPYLPTHKGRLPTWLV